MWLNLNGAPLIGASIGLIAAAIGLFVAFNVLFGSITSKPKEGVKPISMPKLRDQIMKLNKKNPS